MHVNPFYYPSLRYHYLPELPHYILDDSSPILNWHALPGYDPVIRREDLARLPRVLKQLTLLMQDELQSMVLTSLGAYLGLIGGYANTSSAEELAQPSHEWVHSLPPGFPALITATLKLDGSMSRICEGRGVHGAVCIERCECMAPRLEVAYL